MPSEKDENKVVKGVVGGSEEGGGSEGGGLDYKSLMHFSIISIHWYLQVTAGILDNTSQYMCGSQTAPYEIILTLGLGEDEDEDDEEGLAGCVGTVFLLLVVVLVMMVVVVVVVASEGFGVNTKSPNCCQNPCGKAWAALVAWISHNT
ncbi:hypothetical protein M0804_009331 [Polistes exclamans]|nr:hypothetical protein M0804_009331 [Polistes exclamans]